MTPRRSSNGLIAVAVCVFAIGALAAPALAATDSPTADGTQQVTDGETAPAFDVGLQPDGTGDLRVVYTFDLTDDSRAEAFAALQANETAAAAYEDRFRQRLERVAADAAAATDREMRIEDVALTLDSRDETGVVTFSATWHGLAAVDGDRLLVTEPFASGFEPDRPVHLQGPDGYAVADASPTPTSTQDGRLTWASGTDLSDFEVAMEPTDDGGDSTAVATDGSTGPGFGVVAAIVGIVAAVLAAARRR
jgi:PGF-CTERM protein